MACAGTICERAEGGERRGSVVDECLWTHKPISRTKPLCVVW